MSNETGRLPGYMRRIRELRGLSLRAVERATREAGRPIDNSELSKFENGRRSLPFQRLHQLSRIYGIDLQCFDELKELDEQVGSPDPVTGNAEAFARQARVLYKRGDNIEAYRLLERAAALYSEAGTATRVTEADAMARVLLAMVLVRLHKLSLAELELRRLLRGGGQLPPEPRMGALAVLGLAHSQKGEPRVARSYAQEVERQARECGHSHLEATAVQNVGTGYADEGQWDKAATKFRQSLRAIRGRESVVTVRPLALVNLGAALAETDHYKESYDVLRRGLDEARSVRFWRGAALALSNLGNLLQRQGRFSAAEDCFLRCERLIERTAIPGKDIVFVNTFLLWKTAQAQHAPARTRMLFGRLRELRSDVKRWLPEVDEFDRRTSRHPG